MNLKFSSLWWEFWALFSFVSLGWLAFLFSWVFSPLEHRQFWPALADHVSITNLSCELQVTLDLAAQSVQPWFWG